MKYKIDIDKLAIASHLGIRTSAILSIATWAYVFFVRIRGLGCRFISKSVLQKYKRQNKIQPTAVYYKIDKGNYDNVVLATASKVAGLGINHIILLLKSLTKEQVLTCYKSLALLVNRLDFDSNVAIFATQHKDKGWTLSADKLRLLYAYRVTFNRLWIDNRDLLQAALSQIGIDLFDLYDAYVEIDRSGELLASNQYFPTHIN